MAQQPDAPEGRPDRPRWVGFVQLVLIVAAVAVALFFARAPERVVRGVASDLTDEKPKPSVSVVHPEPTEQALTVHLTGAVKLDGKVTVRSEVEGRVVRVSPRFRNGGSIAANEELVKVDPVAFELRVQAAEWAVRKAEARVRMEQARGESEAQAFSRENPGEEPSDWIRRIPSIAKAEAELGLARTALALAELDLARTSVSVPYEARVIRSDAEVGRVVGPADRVGPSSVLGVVYRVEALEVSAPIETADLGYLAPVIGRTARVTALGRTHEAQVVRVSSVVSPKTRLASLFLEFRDGPPPGSLPLPGTFVEVEISGPSYEGVYVLPEAAVQEGGSVWVVDDGVLRSHLPRELGRTDEGWVVEAFDAADGVVLGVLPGARAGLAVVPTDAAASE